MGRALSDDNAPGQADDCPYRHEPHEACVWSTCRDVCRKCGLVPAVLVFVPHGGQPVRLCSSCAGVAPSELWVVERFAGDTWRPIPGCSGENEHAARNVAQALLLMSPGLSADTFRVTRYTPAVAS